METRELAIELAKIIGVEPEEVLAEEIFFTVDRGPRTDTGGGEDGEDWLDDSQAEKLSLEYKEKHEDKIFNIKRFLEDNEIGGSVYWDYTEKGQCQIQIFR